ncbi:hypothetical protein [Halobacteriovorax sp.]|uniref:hypothetical protein n=1 Tax=Halobacteriovorax sp. TaxID=2020862 RepID=UPI003AF1E7E1
MLKNMGSTALLVQPYNGIILSAVKWPYKLVWQKKSGRKLLYNLLTDPKEEHPLEDQDELVTSLWDKMDYIIFTENYLMEKKSLSRKLLTVSE